MSKLTRRPWFGLRSVIAIAASVTVIYMASVVMDRPVESLIVLWLAADLGIVWMAIRILKDPYSTDKTFDEYFYEDREDIRRSEPE